MDVNTSIDGTRSGRVPALRAGVLFAALLALPACNQPPKRIDPTGREAVTSMGVDYGDAQETATSMTHQMLASGSFRTYPRPVLARYNNTINKTSDPNLPVDVVNTRIRSTLLNSGQIQFTSALRTAEGHDPGIREARELANDPMFNQQSVQQSGAMNAVEAPQVSFNSEFLSVYSTDGSAKQRTYELRIFVTDLLTGRVIWEGTSKPIAKLGKN